MFRSVIPKFVGKLKKTDLKYGIAKYMLEGIFAGCNKYFWLELVALLGQYPGT